MIDALAALDCWIGVRLALDWSKVDFTVGTIAIEGTVIHVTGAGLFVQEHTKSEAGMRTIAPPAWLMDMLKERHAEAESEWVFPTTTGTLRDPDYARADLREAVKETHSRSASARPPAPGRDHARRGRGLLGTADYLGHERVSMTQDV